MAEEYIAKCKKRAQKREVLHEELRKYEDLTLSKEELKNKYCESLGHFTKIYKENDVFRNEAAYKLRTFIKRIFP